MTDIDKAAERVRRLRHYVDASLREKLVAPMVLDLRDVLTSYAAQAAELAELRAENRRLSDSLPWCNDKTRADAAERLGEVYRHRMSLSEPYPEIGVVEAQNAQQVVIVLLAQVNACVDELAELRAKLEAAEKEAALRSDMIDSDCMAAINTLRMNEGNSVTLICDNPDFGGPNNAIECSGDWTNWQTKRFTGDRLLTSLQSALKEYFAWHGEECEPPKKLTDLRTAAATFEDEAECFYVQNVERGYVGNNPQFWAKGGKGYTSYIDNAEQFTEADAMAMLREDARKWRVWSSKDVAGCVYRTVESQQLNRLKPVTLDQHNPREVINESEAGDE